MIRHARLFALLATLPFAACTTSLESPGPGPGGDDGSGDVGSPDAGGGGDVPQNCVVESAYPDLGALMGGSALVRPQDMALPDGPKYLTIGVSLGGAGVIDALFIELWDGYGAFANGIVPGTFTIAGPEADLNDCGACVYMAGDLDMGAGTVAQNYMARGGTLTVTSIDPTPGTGRLVGSLSNIQLRQVEYAEADGAQSDVAGGCTTSIAAVSFDTPVAAPQ